MQTIPYFVKHVYGRPLFYIASEAHRLAWKAMTGRVTITQAEMDSLTYLTGVAFERVLEPLQ